jgi:two-component system, chemotaxis family, protein-glutamate methylesterase/glutaminase
MTDTRPPSRVVVVGASAGGIEALRQLLGRLPAGLDAAVCVVLHIPARAPSVLAQILDRAGPLPVSTATDGEPLVSGHVYVAPPDHHLLVRRTQLELSRGPKENGARPAVDPAFRSLAGSQGSTGIGVVLSGALDDGSAGAAVLHEVGATVLVQDPEDALVRSMPESAIRADHPWQVLPIYELGDALAELVGAGHERVEDLAVHDQPDQEQATRLRPAGAPAGLTCPECKGPLWEVREADQLRYRCRIGHAFSRDSLTHQQGAAVEAALWAALQALEERAEFMRNMATRVDALGGVRSHEHYEAVARDAEARADVLRKVLLAPVVELLPDEATG